MDKEESENETTLVEDGLDLIDNLLNNNGIETIVKSEEIKANKRIELNKTFLTYEQFRSELKLYCEETLQLFSITHSNIIK